MDTRVVTMKGVERDEGTVVVFATEEGPFVAVDHRMARDLAMEIAECGPLSVEVEEWQIVGEPEPRDLSSVQELVEMADADLMLEGEWSYETANARCEEYAQRIRTVLAHYAIMPRGTIEEES